MKKTLLSIVTFLTIGTVVNAQNVNVPDVNFKAYLVGNNSINTDGDGEIQVSEATAFTGTIDCSGLSISDLTGVEAFTSLTDLTCFGNSLSSLDVTQNTALTKINCGFTTINSLDLSQNTNLEFLFCHGNVITSLDVTHNTNLKRLFCNNNSLSSIDVSVNTLLERLDFSNNPVSNVDLSLNTALTHLICSQTNLSGLDLSINSALYFFNCSDNSINSLNIANGNNSNFSFYNTSSNPNLSCITVDDVAYSITNWTNVDATSSFSTNCPAPSCTVNIPDVNFKAYLVSNTAINTNGDTEIQCSEASAFNGSMNCDALSISDLAGIEMFTSLTQLDCSNNSLTTLDLSQNTALNFLQSNNNSLTILDLSQNPGITGVFCFNNSLTNLDLNQNMPLTILNCQTNQLTSLDISNFTSLTVLYCGSNQLTDLNVANGNNINMVGSLDPGLIAVNNPNLTCIQIDAGYTPNSTDWQVDVIASFSTNCNAVLVNSISVQGQGGASTITTQGGILQIEADVLPANADDGTYTWSVVNGTGSASLDNNGLLTAITDGTVDVIATANDSSGEIGTTTITISNQSVGVSKNGVLLLVSIYPNPVLNQLSIEVGDLKITRIDIHDYAGRIVKSFTNDKAKSIDVSDLNEGVYILRVSAENGTSTKQFIKQ